MRVQLIAKPGATVTGISRYTDDLRRGLRAAGLTAKVTFPARPPMPQAVRRALHRTGFDVQAFFDNYPLRARLAEADVYHLGGQMLATLLLFQRFPGPVVVSVLDIIPYLVRDDPELNSFRHPMDRLFYRLALKGLGRADMLVAISEYTRQTLITSLGLPGDRISVVYPAVNHEVFRPASVSESFRARYRLPIGPQYVLFVGSEDPRKNVRSLVKAWALVKEEVPGAKLLKVGAPQFTRERERLLRLLGDLELERDVVFYDHVDDRDLPSFYNAATVVVVPSVYEGFGLPAAEAMACGIPVVTARSASLPEVVGDAGIQVDPDDFCALGDALIALLRDPDELRRRSQMAREQAAFFTWQRTGRDTEAVYRRVCGETGDRDVD